MGNQIQVAKSNNNDMQRKFSIQFVRDEALHNSNMESHTCYSKGLTESNSTFKLSVPCDAKKRLNNVGETAVRRLSNTIGWRLINVQDIVNQGKSLCGQYIRERCRRSGVFNKTLGLQRLRSFIKSSEGETISDVLQVLLVIGEELEKMHPRVYNSVCRQVCITLKSDKTIRNLLLNISHECFKCEITWSKIVSFYAVTGALAMDCLRQGHAEYLPYIVDTAGIVIERDMANWIAQQGGWVISF